MFKYRDSKKMGRGQHGWLDSHFHFSFAEYYNPSNIQFGVLRVMNDDLVRPGTGFDTHPHENMEILSYVLNGELTHTDSMGNNHTLTRGQVQYMSAGTGVFHGEHNYGKEMLRFLQIWIFPDKSGYEPNYGDFRFEISDRNEKWLPIATWCENKDSKAPIRIHSDVNVYASIISKGKSLDFKLEPGRQAYLALPEGEAKIGDIEIHARDAVEITDESSFTIKSIEPAHVLLIEMAKG